jgi:hypothetical protein
MKKGVEIGALSKDYKIFGQLQLKATLSPGDAFYEVIKTWDRWSSEVQGF